MKVLITGSRTWKNGQAIIDEMFMLPPNTIIIHGDCQTGADALADATARVLGFEVRLYPADWDLGKKAGPIRNSFMIKVESGGAQKIDLCLAFMDRESPGTRDCMNKCVKAGIPVKRIP